MRVFEILVARVRFGEVELVGASTVEILYGLKRRSMRGLEFCISSTEVSSA